MQRSVKKDVYNRSLERALQILDAFGQDRQVLTCVQLSEILDLSRATVLRLCSTLVKYGYLKQDGELHRYSLGMRMFEQGSVVFYSMSIRKVASPHIEELLRQTRKTIFLAVLDDDELVYIDKREDANSLIRFTSRIATRHPPCWGLCGPLLMAYLPDSEIERLMRKYPLKHYTNKSITDNEEFMDWLHKIRKEGIVIDTERYIDGVIGVAAPIRDFTGKVVAGLGIAVMSSGADTKSVQRMLKAVSKSAHAISQDLGYKEWPNIAQ
jgi:DNA-binding IclR family transcriptional regulator